MLRCPPAALPPLDAGDAVLLDKLRVAPLDEVAAPVRSVTYVPGSEAGRKHTLLVFGGQAAEMPDVLTLVPMHSLNQVSPAVRCSPATKMPDVLLMPMHASNQVKASSGVSPSLCQASAACSAGQVKPCGAGTFCLHACSPRSADAVCAISQASQISPSSIVPVRASKCPWLSVDTAPGTCPACPKRWAALPCAGRQAGCRHRGGSRRAPQHPLVWQCARLCAGPPRRVHQRAGQPCSRHGAHRGWPAHGS